MHAARARTVTQNGQEVHASDMRSVIARLVAEREAAIACLLEALRSTEHDGIFSVAGLQQELRAKGAESTESTATIHALRSELEEVCALGWSARRPSLAIFAPLHCAVASRLSIAPS